MSSASKSHMVSFRLTKEEYEQLRDLCFLNGVGNVSEMARAGLNLLLQQPARVPQESLECRVAEIESRLRLLTLELKRLCQSNHPRSA